MAGKKKKKKQKLGLGGQFLLVVLVLCGVLFTPTTIILLVGMLPTIVAAFIDKTREQVRAITIGCLNLAGCTPSILKLWLSEHTVERSLVILSDPSSWVIMYAAAGMGYCLEWALGGATSVYMKEMAQNRISSIEKKQDELKERWGREVSGEIPLDENGFPLLNPDGEPANSSKAGNN